VRSATSRKKEKKPSLDLTDAKLLLKTS